MGTARWGRYAPLSGVAAVVLWAVAILVIEAVGDTPGDDAGADDILAYFESDETSVYVGAFLFFLGSLALLWFAGTLRTAVAAVEGGVAHLATIVFGAGVAVALTSMAFPAPQVSGAFAANESDAPLTPEAAQALWFAGDGFFVVTEFTAALFLVATAVAALATRVLPAWLAWAGVVVAVVLLIPPIGWAALIVGFPLWVLVTSVLLLRRQEPAATAPA